MPRLGPLTRSDLFHLARLAADRHGEALSLPIFCRETGICESRVYSLVGSWAEVRKAVGLSPKRPGCWVYSDEDLLAEYDRVTRELGCAPSGPEFTRRARMSYETLRRRFGRRRAIRQRHREFVRFRGESAERRATPDRSPDWLYDRWRQRTITYHVRSSDARDRPLHLCELIVCLEHDWPTCPCPALELQTLLASGGRQSPDNDGSPHAIDAPMPTHSPARGRDAGRLGTNRGTDVPRSPTHTGNRRRHPLTPDELIDRVRELAADSDEKLTLRRFTQQSGIPEKEVYRHFSSWTDVRLAAGLPRSTRTGSRYDPDELLRAYDAVVTRLNKLPTVKEFNRLAPMNYQTLATQFGSRDELITSYTAWRTTNTIWRAGDVSPPITASHYTRPHPQTESAPPVTGSGCQETPDASEDLRPPLAVRHDRHAMPDAERDDLRLRHRCESLRVDFQTRTSDRDPFDALPDLLIVWQHDISDPLVPVLELSTLWPWLETW